MLYVCDMYVVLCVVCMLCVLCFVCVVLCALYVWCCVVLCVLCMLVLCKKALGPFVKPMVMAKLSLSTQQRKRTVTGGEEARIQPFLISALDSRE